MNQLRFRTRLVLILSLFAIIPALLLTLLWSGTVSTALPFVTGRPAWDSVAASGEKAIAAARQAPLTPSQRRAIDAHERERAFVKERLDAAGRELGVMLPSSEYVFVAAHLCAITEPA